MLEAVNATGACLMPGVTEMSTVCAIASMCTFMCMHVCTYLFVCQTLCANANVCIYACVYVHIQGRVREGFSGVNNCTVMNVADGAEYAPYVRTVDAYLKEHVIFHYRYDGHVPHQMHA